MTKQGGPVFSRHHWPRFQSALTAQPLLASAGLSVIAYGLSLVAEDGNETAYLIRSFVSLEERDAQEAAFYGSDAWRQGPREAVVSRIESLHTVVLQSNWSIAADGSHGN